MEDEGNSEEPSQFLKGAGGFPVPPEHGKVCCQDAGEDIQESACKSGERTERFLDENRVSSHDRKDQ